MKKKEKGQKHKKKEKRKQENKEKRETVKKGKRETMRKGEKRHRWLGVEVVPKFVATTMDETRAAAPRWRNAKHFRSLGSIRGGPMNANGRCEKITSSAWRTSDVADGEGENDFFGTTNTKGKALSSAAKGWQRGLKAPAS